MKSAKKRTAMKRRDYLNASAVAGAAVTLEGVIEVFKHN